MSVSPENLDSYLVVFDFDNVLVDTYQLVELARRVGVMRPVQNLMQDWQQGRGELRTLHLEALQILRGMTLQQVYEVAKSMPLMRGAEEAIAIVKRISEVAVITNGYRQTCETICEKLGISIVISNDLIFNKADVFTGRIIENAVDDIAKAHALRKLCDLLNVPIANTVAIGDGANDIPVLRIAGLAVGFNPEPALSEFVHYSIDTKDLREVVHVIRKHISQG